jgi:hypothetical protein
MPVVSMSMQTLAHEDRKRAELEKAERRQMSEEQRERCGTALHCTARY